MVRGTEKNVGSAKSSSVKSSAQISKGSKGRERRFVFTYKNVPLTKQDGACEPQAIVVRNSVSPSVASLICEDRHRRASPGKSVWLHWPRITDHHALLNPNWRASRQARSLPRIR
jgi:hypothetical protein